MQKDYANVRVGVREFAKGESLFNGVGDKKRKGIGNKYKKSSSLMIRGTKMNYIKYTIDYLLNFKCLTCQDKSFCKLKKYYHQMENPTAKDIENLSKCLFYKKQKIS